MADRTKIETGAEQHTILDNDQKKGTTIGHRANVRRDDTLDASFLDETLSSEEERIYRKAEAENIRHPNRDQVRETKLPSDPLDPDFNQPPGPKNPHKP